MSANHFSFGRMATKSRFSRFEAALWALLRLVVDLNHRLCLARRPANPIKRATRFLLHIKPCLLMTS